MRQWMRRRWLLVVALVVALLVAAMLMRLAQRPTYQPVYFPYPCDIYWYDPYCWKLPW